MKTNRIQIMLLALALLLALAPALLFYIDMANMDSFHSTCNLEPELANTLSLEHAAKHFYSTAFAWILCAIGFAFASLWILKQNKLQHRQLLELDRRGEDLKSLINCIPASVVLIDDAGKWSLVNRSACNFFELESADAIGKHYEEIQPLGSKGRERLHALKEYFCAIPSQPQGLHRRWRAADRLVDMYCIPTHDAENQETGVLHLFFDITRDERTQRGHLDIEVQLQQMRKSDSLTHMAGGIAHDFNNLLMGIMGNVELALLSLPADRHERITLEEAMKAARSAAELTRQMLTYSGNKLPNLADLDMAKLVADYFDAATLSHYKSKLIRSIPTPSLPIHADKEQLIQVFDAVLQNAKEASTKSDAEIQILTGIMNCDSTYLAKSAMSHPVQPGSFVYIDVQDFGCGMDGPTQNRIFDPFFSTKFTGRGLGMAAAMGILRAHAGAIVVKSRPNHGTTIRVLLPMKAPSPNLAPPQQRNAKSVVLLVDDDEIVLKAAEGMLKVLKYQVLVANGGREAVKVFKARHQDLYCVILDYSMPEMDGGKVYDELCLINPAVPVVLSSGYNRFEAISHFLGKGLAGFIQKPYTRQELEVTLNPLKPNDLPS
jgi:two-component system, cell cycle sensor histidine kinase and response regulator CckA